MDYPHGHTHHHSHHRRDEREEVYPPPPPPPHVGPPFDPYRNQPPPPPHVRPAAFDPYYNQPPPPPAVTHVHHSSHGVEPYPHYPPPPVIDHHRPPTHDFHYSPETPVYPPPPRADPYPSGSNVHHVSHESKPHHLSPHMPSFIHNHSHHHQGPDVPIHKPTVRVYCKAETNYSLTIRDGKVILAPSNPSDPFQHWIKDEKFSTKVKDEQGFPSFSLVNEATGQAMKHSIGATHPVQLTHYNPDKLDESVLWTLSKDLGDSYRTIRMVNNIRLNVDAFNGDENHGGVRDGTTIVLWEWKKGGNQRWKIIPYWITPY